ncbi:hypothetical protein ZWY2020_050506 [Hordeum vulgare]|nr:hypothetical protein ZWY2020_050506 [Hordeum vulgare]
MAPAPPPPPSLSGKARARPKRRLHQARGSDDNAGRRKAPRLRLVHGEEGAPPRYNFPVIDPTADDGAALVPGVHASPGTCTRTRPSMDPLLLPRRLLSSQCKDLCGAFLLGLDGQYDHMYDGGGGSLGFVAKNGEDERSRGQGMDLDREFAKNGEDELSRGQGLDLDLNGEFAKNGKDELSRGQGLDLT